MKKAISKLICIFMTLCFVLLYVFSGVVLAESEDTEDEVKWQDYNGKRIGVLTGTLMEDAAVKYFPDSEYFYFNSYPDCNVSDWL